MASQISHIIYAKKLFDRLEQGELPDDLFDGKTIRNILTHKDIFLLGCTFPDIRYVEDNLSRKDTHMFFAQVDLDLRNLDPFLAGCKFHTYCDMKREELLNKYNFYAIAPNVEESIMANKMLEDELIYDTYNNWEKMSLFFNNIPPIATPFNVSKETLEFWYSTISSYIEKKPTDKSIHIFIIKIRQQEKRADAIAERIKELRKNPSIEEALKKISLEII